MKKNINTIIILMLLSGLPFACIKQPDAPPQISTANRPLSVLLKNAFTFSMFYNALVRTGLDTLLSGKDAYTVLAPDNAAFAASGITADSLARVNTDILRKWMRYHIILDSLAYHSLPARVDMPFTTVAGVPVYLSVPVNGLGVNSLHVNGVQATGVDIPANNGYMILLPQVLNYPAPTIKAWLESRPQYSYFTQALRQFGLLDRLDQSGPFVVLAPNNDAFLNNGIDEAALTALDTATYQKMLFSNYIMPSQRFFISDFKDAPPAKNGLPGLITPEGILQHIELPYTGPATYDFIPLNFGYIIAHAFEPPYNAPPYNGDYHIYGPKVTVIDPDHVAGNGVIGGLNGLAVLPENAKN